MLEAPNNYDRTKNDIFKYFHYGNSNNGHIDFNTDTVINVKFAIFVLPSNASFDHFSHPERRWEGVTHTRTTCHGIYFW